MNVTETTPPTARKFTLEVNEDELHILHSLVGATYPALFSIEGGSALDMLGDMYDGMKDALGVRDSRYNLRVTQWTNKQ